MHFLVTQFSPGLDACAQVVRLALRVNFELESRGQERFRIMVPWLYGERQVQRLREICVEQGRRDANEVVLDERYGRILAPFLLSDCEYAMKIAIWVSGWQDASRAVRAHFSQEFTVTNLMGQSEMLDRPNISLELSRSPRLRLGVARAYQVTNAPLTRLFQNMEGSRGLFSLGAELIQGAQKIAAELERNLVRTYVAVPSAFEGVPPGSTNFSMADRTYVPPLIPPLSEIGTDLPPDSVYVTMGEASDMDAGLRVALSWGVPIYTNDPERLGGGIFAEPNSLASADVQFHYARGSDEELWRSLQAAKPLLLCPFNSADDPEIYFNGEQALRLGLAHRLGNESISELKTKLSALTPKIEAINTQLNSRFEIMDGTAVAAREIVDDILRNPRPAYE